MAGANAWNITADRHEGCRRATHCAHVGTVTVSVHIMVANTDGSRLVAASIAVAIQIVPRREAASDTLMSPLELKIDGSLNREIRGWSRQIALRDSLAVASVRGQRSRACLVIEAQGTQG